VVITIVGVLTFLLIVLWVGLVLTFGISLSSTQDTLIESSISADGKYALEAYKIEPGATVDFSIKVYIKTDSDKKLIYNAYHESNVEIKWISNSQVSINGKTLDLSKNETFDWRND
ncbi:MAG: DUF5412 family protein, partial [Clostridia bacterium]